MQPYANKSGNSGVVAFTIGSDFIVVAFTGGALYTYDYATAGKKHVEAMKTLARDGRGLSTYISQHVHDRYV